jgi:hypothetical protein
MNVKLISITKPDIEGLQNAEDFNTQKEHRLIADECKNIFVKNFPTISEALQWKAE